jgi:SAM-dependent methyltransferase
MAARVNVGCGAPPTPGWDNLDNSLTVRLAALGPLPTLLQRLRFISSEHLAFARTARAAPIKVAPATRLPYPDDSVEVVYSSHMIEHLDRTDATRFVTEAFRVLRRGGALRLVAPDLRMLVDEYTATGDADRFVAATRLAMPRPRGWRARLNYRLSLDRHAWMYDATTLLGLVEAAGFVDAAAIEPGTTRIADPGPLNLREREGESIYVEATKP